MNKVNPFHIYIGLSLVIFLGLQSFPAGLIVLAAFSLFGWDLHKTNNKVNEATINEIRQITNTNATVLVQKLNELEARIVPIEGYISRLNTDVVNLKFNQQQIGADYYSQPGSGR